MDNEEDLRALSVRAINLIRNITHDESLVTTYLNQLAETHDENLEQLFRTLILEANFQMDLMM